MSKSSRKNQTIRLEPALKQRIHFVAVREGKHISDVIEEAVLLYLSQKEMAA